MNTLRILGGFAVSVSILIIVMKVVLPADKVKEYFSDRNLDSSLLLFVVGMIFMALAKLIKQTETPK
jgi:hypothetical protein